jgi:hypothetical protein
MNYLQIDVRTPAETGLHPFYTVLKPALGPMHLVQRAPPLVILAAGT